MVEKHTLSNEDITACLHTDYGIEVTTLKCLPIGADMNASVYKVEADGHATYFVKIKRGHNQDMSLVVLALLHDAGIQQIIPPVKTKHRQISQRKGDFTLIVYPFIQGQDGFSRNLTDDHWYMLGKVLRQVHEFDVPSSVLGRIKKETYSNEWRKAVRSIWTHIDVEPTKDVIALQLTAFMKKHQSTIERLVERSEVLGKIIQKQSTEFVLCHSDIHGGNVIVADHGAIYIVDWDDPIMAPKERDLMFIGGGVANVWNNAHEEECFYQGYGKTEINQAILAYYRHERIVEDIALYSQSLLLTNDGGDGRQTMYKHFIDMFEPRGVVDIAFKTDSKNGPN